MGFEFVLNFNLPYFATNPSDFWRRWHISLSTLAARLPLQIARRQSCRHRAHAVQPDGDDGAGRTVARRRVELRVVGHYHGAILVVHRLATPALQTIETTVFKHAARTWFVVRVVCMFALTFYGWLLFRATSLDQVADMTASLTRIGDGVDWNQLGLVAAIIAPLVCVQIIQLASGELMFLKTAARARASNRLLADDLLHVVSRRRLRKRSCTSSSEHESNHHCPDQPRVRGDRAGDVRAGSAHRGPRALRRAVLRAVLDRHVVPAERVRAQRPAQRTLRQMESQLARIPRPRAGPGPHQRRHIRCI